MNNMNIGPLFDRLDKLNEKLKILKKAIECFQSICDHKFEYKYHDGMIKVFECLYCRKRAFDIIPKDGEEYLAIRYHVSYFFDKVDIIEKEIANLSRSIKNLQSLCQHKYTHKYRTHNYDVYECVFCRNKDRG